MDAMIFLSTYWLVFMIATGVFGAWTVVLQLRNVRSIVDSISTIRDAPLDDLDEVVTHQQSGMWFKGVAVCALFAGVCGVLALIGVIGALIDYSKTMP